MNTLREALQEYLALRRSLGFKMHDASRVLPRFVAFMEEREAPHITSRLALEWVLQAKMVQPAERTRRLGLIRGFAATAAPPTRSPRFPRRSSCRTHQPERDPTCTPSRKCGVCWRRRCNCQPRGHRRHCAPGSFTAFWVCSASRVCAFPKRSI
jgi:hypothetical protein